MEIVDKIVWGIIGAGDVCERKSAPAMYKTPYSEVKIVMRRNADKAEDFAKRHGIGKWTTNIEDLLNDKEINAIYIATPPSSHAELTVKAAKAGKAVYVEKPMANSSEECEIMIQACRNANVPLFVAYYRRTLPGYLKVKELIESGELGDVRAVNIEMYKPLSESDLKKDISNWRVDPELAGGGYFHDLASHQLDFLDFLFGKITHVKGISTNQAQAYKSDDIVSATFQFETGVLGTGLWCFAVDKISEKESLKIIGSKGELSFNCFGDPMVIQLKSSISGTQEFIYLHEQPVQQVLIQLIVDQLRGQGIAPSTSASGARTTSVMDEISSFKKRRC